MPPQILAVINTKEMNTITSPSAVLSTMVLRKKRLENYCAKHLNTCRKKMHIVIHLAAMEAGSISHSNTLCMCNIQKGTCFK
jgi:hypothetical protein